MTVRSVTTVKYFVRCDWCDKEVECFSSIRSNQNVDSTADIDLPEGWEHDWDANDEYPPTYCSAVHMERAQQVAELKRLP